METTTQSMPTNGKLYTFNVNGQDFKLNRSYTPIKKIGEGAYGLVCAATDDETKERVAIKRIRPTARDEFEARHTLREITIMRLCDRHPNVISLRGLSLNEAEDELYIVMELMFSDLYRIIKHVRPLNPGQVKVILKQILKGLETLHSIGVIHRDLKPGNLLVTKECQVRISDFGLARFYRDVKERHSTIGPESYEAEDNSDAGGQQHHQHTPSKDEEDLSEAVTMTQYVVTRWYRCPELLLAPHLPYATAVDVWSVGCIFAEMLLGEPLFPGTSNPDQVRRILRVLGSPANQDFGFTLHPEAAKFLEREPFYAGKPLKAVIPQASECALDLLQGFLTMDPTERITVREALAHPYFADAPPSPGGELSLADFLELWEDQEVNLDFERKDASLSFLRHRIYDEVAQMHSRTDLGVTAAGDGIAALSITASQPTSESPPSPLLPPPPPPPHHPPTYTIAVPVQSKQRAIEGGEGGGGGGRRRKTIATTTTMVISPAADRAEVAVVEMAAVVANETDTVAYKHMKKSPSIGAKIQSMIRRKPTTAIASSTTQQQPR